MSFQSLKTGVEAILHPFQPKQVGTLPFLCDTVEEVETEPTEHQFAGVAKRTPVSLSEEQLVVSQPSEINFDTEFQVR